MKTKSVAYRDLFDPTKTVVASNRMWTAGARDVFEKARDEVHELYYVGNGGREYYLRDKAKDTKCRCRHPMIADGICHYRTCRHTVETHA